MNTQSVPARRCEKLEDVKAVGDFFIYQGRDNYYQLVVWLPGAPHAGGLPVRIGPQNKPDERLCWGWDGNFDKPTLEPSINMTDVWHGWLKAGQLISC